MNGSQPAPKPVGGGWGRYSQTPCIGAPPAPLGGRGGATAAWAGGDAPAPRGGGGEPAEAAAGARPPLTGGVGPGWPHPFNSSIAGCLRMDVDGNGAGHSLAARGRVARDRRRPVPGSKPTSRREGTAQPSWSVARKPANPVLRLSGQTGLEIGDEELDWRVGIGAFWHALLVFPPHGVHTSRLA